MNSGGTSLVNNKSRFMYVQQHKFKLISICLDQPFKQQVLIYFWYHEGGCLFTFSTSREGAYLFLVPQGRTLEPLLVCPLTTL